MRALRALFALAGLAALAFGAWLAWDFVRNSIGDGIQAALYFVAGPVVHDGLVAPIVGVTGLLIARLLPKPWRAPVAVGAVLSAVLVLLAVPLLWRPFGVPTNPGLHDRNYALWLGVSLGVVWLGAGLIGLGRSLLTQLPVLPDDQHDDHDVDGGENGQRDRMGTHRPIELVDHETAQHHNGNGVGGHDLAQQGEHQADLDQPVQE